MELFQARDNYIIKDGYYSLWCNRIDGGIVARQGVPPTEAFDPVCKGKVYGIIGKIQLFPGTEWKLLVITKRTLLGLFPGNHEVYRIDRIAVLPLAEGDVTELELDLCDKHQAVGKPKGSGDGQQKGFERTWQSMKIAVTNMKDNVKNTNMQKDIKDKEKDKLERRLLEEIFKMFNDSDSFIYSPTGDITNTQQKQCGEHYNSSLPQWKRVDERFFWNKYMLQDLVNNEDPLDLCSRWIIPVVQGYCQIVHCVNKFEEEEPDELIEKNRGELPEEEFELILISRRSIHRAGTRYKRRGVDEDGEVANFVETEQIIRTEIHSVSFVQVRGSVPIYWSQPGFKYRPPPRLDKGEEETLLAFMSHFAHQLKYYGGVVIVNLLDQTGREQIIGDALMENILMFNNPLLTYVTYDFHEYCRGMKFENVAILVDSINDIIKEMRYCWTDAKGIICEQRSVFRVNCMDCLDRTNVVQAALGRHVMEVQLRKLGKLLPDQNLPSDIRASFQEMWANNGDAISRQYAGTAAMKGDFTRTGERNFKGLMKDGYNSANRYYLNRFKAVYRQTVIDAMLGNPLTEDLTQAMAALKNGDEEYPWTMEREECVAQLVVHCQHLLLADTEECLGGWALVDPFYNSEGDLNQDQDVILLLTHDAYFVASYDDDEEQITQYERIALEDVEKIEIGFEPSFKTRYLFIRIHHKLNGTSGYFHTLRTIQHRTPDEARGVLLGIANTFTTAPAKKSLGIKISECNKLDKKKSKGPPEVTQISSESRLSGWSKPNKPKNLIDIDIDEEDTPITRAKSSSGVFHSFLRDHLTGMPRPYSDPCLARQNEDEYKPERKKSGHSAPVSSGSSSSSSSDDEGTFKGKGGLAMRLDKEKPLKSATKLVCRSDDVLTSTRTDDDNEEKTKNNQNVNVDELIQINTEESDDLVASPKDENQSENTTLSENINGNNLSGLETSNEDTKATQQDTKEEQITTNTSDLSNNLENQDAVIESENQSTGNVAVNSTESQASGEQNSRNTKFSKENCVAVNCTENQESGEQGTRNTEFPNCVAPSVDITEENNIETEIVPCIGDEKSNKVECATSDLKEHSSETECLLDIGGEKSDTVESTNAGKENQDDIHELECNFATKEIKDDINDAGTQLIDFEDIPKIRESYIESKKKLRNENTDLLNLKEDQESSTQETSKPIGTSPLVRLGLGGGLRSMTVSFKSSSSIEKEDQVNTTENTTEQEANKRDSTGLLGNRSPSTSRSGKGNIFASAQARSKNFIPDLRNKLSNISFQRSKSPRLAHKQLSTDPGTNDELVVENHKKHKRKHKCLTRIIEI